MAYKTLEQLGDIKGKRVLVRVDLDIPLNMDFKVTDDTRLQAMLPTINYLLNNNAKVILFGHMGRPNGERVFDLSLKPLTEPLEKLLEKDVYFCKYCNGLKAEKQVSEMENGEVLLLENTRFKKGETENNAALNQEFAALADIYINDAFATSHRAHSSTVGVAKLVKDKAIGRSLQKEIETLAEAIKDPKKPFLIIIGGAKISTKIGVLENLIPRANQIIIGGAMANTFLKAKNYPIGNSLYEPNCVDMARGILTTAGVTGCRVQLPHGVTVASALEEYIATRSVAIDNIQQDDMILDVGERTLDIWKKLINEAGTILWNGPIGAFETKPFDEGTTFIAKAVANSSAFSIIGGGDTLAAVKISEVDISKFDYVSSAGGAMLELLEGKKLPAISALE